MDAISAGLHVCMFVCFSVCYSVIDSPSVFVFTTIHIEMIIIASDFSVHHLYWLISVNLITLHCQKTCTVVLLLVLNA